MFRHQNAWPNHIKTADRSFGNAGKFNYLRMTLTNKNAFSEKLRINYVRVMHSTIQYRALLKYT
jgi:hypothetical protein